MGKLTHVKQVGGDSRHKLTDFGLIKIAERHCQQVSEHILAHIFFNFDAHSVTDINHIIACRHIDKLQYCVHCRESENELEGEF